MIRVLVDSGSSIKQEEKEKLNVEILPLKILMGETEYLDGVNLSLDDFYKIFIGKNIFPKTSLPSLETAQNMIRKMIEMGDEVIVLPISSKISGTYASLKMLFADEERVRVIDTKSAVGGIRILVDEVNKYRDKSLDFVEKKINELIPRLQVIAIPESLEYLYKGGRLSKAAYVAGSLMNIKPLISLDSISGEVKLVGKVRGLKKAMKEIVNRLSETGHDSEYQIVPSYTYNKDNLDELIEMTDDKYYPYMGEYDNLDPALACHWGPNAFGYIWVSEK
ncbi:MAG: DegV family protein [Eubacterium sp.]|nr:DegV family protein [Eubacterium sp.]